MENTTTPNQPTAEISLQDLAVIKTCLEAAATRGAFRAEEMKAVGTVYERLATFLKAAQPPTPEVSSAPPTDDPAAITPIDAPADNQGA